MKFSRWQITLKTPPELLRSHRGHLASSYIKLVNFLVEQQTGLHYAWASPMLEQARRGGISEDVARELSELLADATSLVTEEVTLTGELVRANLNTGKWGLSTEDGSRYGETAEYGPSLGGLTIGERYRFVCIEDVEMDVSGENATLYLKSSEPI